MSNAMVALGLTVGSVLLNMLLQLLSYRIIKNVGYMKSVFIGFVGGAGMLFAGECLRFYNAQISLPSVVISIIGDIGIYICAGYLFFNVINVGESSIRMRILRELYRAKLPISESELLSQYNDSRILQTRLQRLLGNRQIMIVDGRYQIKPGPLLFMARIMMTLKKTLLRRVSEFD